MSSKPCGCMLWALSFLSPYYFSHKCVKPYILYMLSLSCWFYWVKLLCRNFSERKWHTLSILLTFGRISPSPIFLFTFVKKTRRLQGRAHRTTRKYRWIRSRGGPMENEKVGRQERAATRMDSAYQLVRSRQHGSPREANQMAPWGQRPNKWVSNMACTWAWFVLLKITSANQSLN